MTVRVPGARLTLVAAVLAAATLLVATLLRPPPRVLPDAPVAPRDPTSTAPAGVDPAPTPTPAAANPASAPPAAPTSVPATPRDPEDTRPPERGVVAGTVRDRQGRPVPGAIVRRLGAKGGRSGRTTTDASGTFRLVGLPPGRVPLEVVVPDVVTHSDGIGTTGFEAAAGATDVEVVVDLGLDVVLRWADAGPAPASVTVHVVRAGGPPRLDPKLGADGTATIRGLVASDRLVVWVPADAEGRSVVVRDAKPEGEIALRRAEGRSIAGVVRALGTAGATTVWAEEPDLGVRVVGSLAPDGRYEVRGLPEGTRWRVAATIAGSSDEDPGKSVTVDDVRPGANVDLDLSAAK